MKLIIWWCFLMIIITFSYLFWLKKRRRLLFGVIILIVAMVGYSVPNEIAHSKLVAEIEKEKIKPLQQLQKSLKNISDDKSKPTDSEKTLHEKLIVKKIKKNEKLREKIMKGGEDKKNLKDFLRSDKEIRELGEQWVRRWWKNNQTLLFCGEEFNQELTREKTIGKNKSKEVKDYNIIDFGLVENNKIDSFQKKLEQICQQEENNPENLSFNYPIIWLKNIDKITNSEVKEKILAVIDFEKNSNLGKYNQEIKTGEKIEKNINFSQFSLMTTTSVANPKLTPELRTKLKHIESFWDEYCWLIFIFSLGIEAIVFYLLIKNNKKKQKNQSLLTN